MSVIFSLITCLSFSSPAFLYVISSMYPRLSFSTLPLGLIASSIAFTSVIVFIFPFVF